MRKDKGLSKQFYDACIASYREYSKGSDVSFYIAKKADSPHPLLNMVGKYFLEVLKIATKHNKEDLDKAIDKLLEGSYLDFSEDGSLSVKNEGVPESYKEFYKERATSINILNSLKYFDEKKFFKFPLVRVKSSKEILEFIESFLRSLSVNLQYKKDSFEIIHLKNMKMNSFINYPEFYYDYSDYVVDIHISPNQNRIRFNIFPTRFVLDKKIIPIRNHTIFSMEEFGSMLSHGAEFKRNLEDSLVDALKLIFNSNYGGIAKLYNYGNLVTRAVSRHKSFYIFHNAFDLISDGELEELATDIDKFYDEISNSIQDISNLKIYSSMLVEHLNNLQALDGSCIGVSYWIYGLLSRVSGSKVKFSSYQQTSPENIEPLIILKDPISTLGSFGKSKYIAIPDKKLFGKNVVNTFKVAPATFSIALDVEVGPSVI